MGQCSFQADIAGAENPLGQLERVEGLLCIPGRKAEETSADAQNLFRGDGTFQQCVETGTIAVNPAGGFLTCEDAASCPLK